ncbi:MAG: hypothetical protein F2703_02710 [Actinobacteria bacterium]|uniref:Unannotated protein n=1 Tax=freshwater metagenome TaxID=449393 RepID=A0A6J6TCX4_9ZZZZ|nr:hypothetical protein [Actinomycetota bacterium]MSY63966.1 hypothetical protein [Actinomycetota bacterium]MSZ90784.1 hypothetical protein [Actinomycetota bacterium]
MSSAATALIWWIVPAVGLIGGLGYVLWISKFQEKFQQETQRSVGQFQRFQDSLRTSQARDIDSSNRPSTGTSSAAHDADSVASKPDPEFS